VPKRLICLRADAEGPGTIAGLEGRIGSRDNGLAFQERGPGSIVFSGGNFELRVHGNIPAMLGGRPE
jgi:hypothetical protein